MESGLKKVTRGVYIPAGGTGEFAIMHEEGFVLYSYQYISAKGSLISDFAGPFPGQQ